ncbi:MAG: ATP-binding protein [Anaerolineae bacterium]|jgi:signal transduction histidine kinase|nr:ATP-binding protein [Anaerolineae bacterium]
MRSSFFQTVKAQAQQYEMKAFPPSFQDETLEQEMKALIHDDNIPAARIAIGIGAFALILFAIASWYNPSPEYPRYLTILHFLIDLLTFGILFWITYTAFGKKHLSNLLGFSVIWFSVSINFNNIVLTSTEVYNQYFIGVILLVFTAYVFIRGNWYIPLLSGFLIHVFYIIISPLSDISNLVLLQNNLYLMMANMIGSVVNYNAEFTDRREFWQQKQLEKERANLAEANRSLDAIVSQRTTELNSSKAFMSNLANGAANDLMAPLYATIGYFELIVKRNKEKMDATSQNFVAEVYRQGARLRDMLESLVEYSRLQESEIRHAQVDINMVVQIVLQQLKPVVQETNASISIPPLPAVNGNENQLVILFRNLVENALLFHGDTQPEIRIDAEYEPNNEVWVFSVQDKGLGIAKANQNRLFEFFTRISPEADLSRIGMGLAICKHIVELHGGKIWVESELGKGSTFYFTIKGSEHPTTS